MVRVTFIGEVVSNTKSGAWEELGRRWHELLEEGRLPEIPQTNVMNGYYFVQVSSYLLSPFTFDITKIPAEMVKRATCVEQRANFFRRDGLYEIKGRDIGIESDDVCRICVVSTTEHGCLVQDILMDAPTTALLRAAYKAFFEGGYRKVIGGEWYPLYPVSDWTQGTHVVTHPNLNPS